MIRGCLPSCSSKRSEILPRSVSEFEHPNERTLPISRSKVSNETILAGVNWNYQDARNRSASQQTSVCRYSFDYGNWVLFSGENTGHRVSGSVAFVLHGAWPRSFRPQEAVGHHQALCCGCHREVRLLANGSLSGSPDYPVLPDCPK